MAEGAQAATASRPAQPGRPPSLRAAARTSPPEDGGVTVRRCGSGKVIGLYATRAFQYGESVLRERPALLVPRDAAAHLRAVGSEAMLAVSKQLGDSERLAAFGSFCRLPQDERDAILAMGVSQGSTVVQDIQRVISMFLKDCPQFSSALDWELFARVVGVVSDRGTKLPGGERALYLLSDQAAHSCAPNAVIETLGDEGVREVRVISYLGIAQDEELTLSYAPEDVLLQPLPSRRTALASARRGADGGAACGCGRCSAGDDPEAPLPLLRSIMGASKDSSEEALRERIRDLERLDALLPFATAGKARARARLAQACEERPAGSGRLLEEAAELYETSLEETALVLGQKALQNADNVRRRLAQVRERLE